MGRLLLPTMFLFLFIAASANADTIPWKEVDGWTIAVDPSLGDGCFIASDFDNKVELRIGFDHSVDAADPGYVLLSSENWKSIQDDKTYDLVFQLGARSRWDATAVGGEMGPAKTLWVGLNDADFFAELTRRLSMNVSYDGKNIARMSWTRSGRAISELYECEAEVKRFGLLPSPGPKDPFAAAEMPADGPDAFAP